MKRLLLAAVGWLVPGGAYLIQRRYLQFAIFAALVCSMFAAGLALHGGYRWPGAVDLAGVDGLTSLTFKAGVLAKALAGGPFLVAHLLGGPDSFLDSRLHEYGSTLLMMAGLLNLLAAADAMEVTE